MLDLNLEADEKVKEIVVPVYQHSEAGLPLTLRDMTLYLLNPEDFQLEPSAFVPGVHEHAIPKFEMARIYLLVCALTGGDLGFAAEDQTDPVFAIYERAFRRTVLLEKDPEIQRALVRLGLRCGFSGKELN